MWLSEIFNLPLIALDKIVWTNFDLEIIKHVMFL